MSKKLYVSSAGIAHKTTKLRVGINNVSRNVVKGYVGVNGIAKQFWPVDPIYVWNRYNAEYPTVYKIENWSTVISGCTHACSARYSPVCTNYTIENNGTFVLSGEETTRYNPGTFYVTSVSIIGDNLISDVSGTAGTYKIGETDLYEVYLHSTSFNISYAYRANFTTEKGDAEKGALVDQVTSTISDQYPSDGVSGSYWYVYVGER